MSEFLSLAMNISFGLVILAILLAFYRLLRGPSLPDRVVALDMMTVSIVAFCALFAILTDNAVFLDIALVLALVGFLATVALARFAERNLANAQRSRSAREAEAKKENPATANDQESAEEIS